MVPFIERMRIVKDLILEKVTIEDVIYELRGKQVMLDSEMSVVKCHKHLNYKIVTYYDIGEPISVFSKQVSTKFGKEINIW